MAVLSKRRQLFDEITEVIQQVRGLDLELYTFCVVISSTALNLLVHLTCIVPHRWRIRTAILFPKLCSVSTWNLTSAGGSISCVTSKWCVVLKLFSYVAYSTTRVIVWRGCFSSIYIWFAVRWSATISSRRYFVRFSVLLLTLGTFKLKNAVAVAAPRPSQLFLLRQTPVFVGPTRWGLSKLGDIVWVKCSRN